MRDVVSVDGFIADDNDDPGPLHEWYFSGDTPLSALTDGGEERFDHSVAGSDFKVSRASADYVRPMWESIGALVMGRRLFDLVNGRRVSHPRATMWSWCPTGPSPRAGTRKRPTISSTTWPLPSPWPRPWPGSGRSAGTPRRRGGDGRGARRVGSGKRYFGSITGQQPLDDPHVIVQGERVLHLRFKVRRPQAVGA
jgi:hypothetical protein